MRERCLGRAVASMWRGHSDDRVEPGQDLKIPRGTVMAASRRCMATTMAAAHRSRSFSLGTRTSVAGARIATTSYPTRGLTRARLQNLSCSACTWKRQ
jgi:hypothetical protein